MLRTIEATINEHGQVELAEPLTLTMRCRALVTILEESTDNDVAILAESALAEGWSGPEADEEWKHLSELPDIGEANQ